MVRFIGEASLKPVKKPWIVCILIMGYSDSFYRLHEKVLQAKNTKRFPFEILVYRVAVMRVHQRMIINAANNLLRLCPQVSWAVDDGIGAGSENTMAWSTDFPGSFTNLFFSYCTPLGNLVAQGLF